MTSDHSYKLSFLQTNYACFKQYQVFSFVDSLDLYDLYRIHMTRAILLVRFCYSLYITLTWSSFDLTAQFRVATYYKAHVHYFYALAFIAIY